MNIHLCSLSALVEGLFANIESSSVCVCVCCLEGDLKNEHDETADKSAIRSHLSLQISDEETHTHTPV